MKPPMLHTAYKVTTTRDAYGSFTASGSTALPCHFRVNNSQITGSGDETVQSDAMAWFEPDSGIALKDIIRFGSRHYRVERVIEARRLRETAVQFIKCDLKIYGVIS
jgi:hypothetical protein